MSLFIQSTDDKAEKGSDLDNQYKPVKIKTLTIAPFQLDWKDQQSADSLCDKPDRHIVKLIFALTFHKLKIK